MIIPDILECLGDINRIQGGHRDSARLLGIADAPGSAWGRFVSRCSTPSMRRHCGNYVTLSATTTFDEAVGRGGRPLSIEEAIAYLQRGRGERKRPASGWASLTPTERDVVRLVGEGLANKDVAARLFVSPRTVESHLTHVYTKLGLSSRVQLAQEATRRGEVD